MIVWEFFGAATHKASRFDCEGIGIAPTLPRPLRGLRQGVAQFETGNKKTTPGEAWRDRLTARGRAEGREAAKARARHPQQVSR